MVFFGRLSGNAALYGVTAARKWVSKAAAETAAVAVSAMK